MSETSLGLGANLQRYLLEISLREPEACSRLRAYTASLPDSNMLSSPEQVQLLELLCKLLDARQALEVGTYTGYTSLRLTLGLPQLRVTCCDINRDYAKIAQTFWRDAGVDSRIDLRIAPALETLDALIVNGATGSYDFAYIDADKSSYRGYVERCMVLVRVGGLIALDNTLWSGSVADPKNQDPDTLALKQLNLWLHAGEAFDYDLSLVPIGDGLTLLRKIR